MKSNLFFLAATCLMATASVSQFGCSTAPVPKADTVDVPKEMSHADMVDRGKYLVTAIGCKHCHTPKVMTAMGPVADSTRMLSGHPANQPFGSFDKIMLKPGFGAYIGPDFSSFLGPWGVSFSANLTPDSATGIGSWDAHTFMKTLRTGKHLGQDGGRGIMPPMPYDSYAMFSDDDLKSIFAFLQSIPAISNKVPAAISPEDLAKMK